MLLLLAATGALFVLDRLLLAAEARGWVYYRRRQRVGIQAGAAIAAELGAILSPAERARQEAVAHREFVPSDLGGAFWPGDDGRT